MVRLNAQVADVKHLPMGSYRSEVRICRSLLGLASVFYFKAAKARCLISSTAPKPLIFLYCGAPVAALVAHSL